ncbi:hypothetical protein HYH02_007429 [Chlamydomonas schloesseri]|uniref:GCK domain-containing protein n=1 Tax=Chlamydomonas schloesseri TaxID=2026947 RepID=A0A836B519_9CHLO|nr:hypothetical protein HYH02_007429 [Chlamydomonas schloesseri]|eukprot:KAG2447504.1 hypothetical protein HYH02_007429 [Chlamydomonas schloesseri]
MEPEKQRAEPKPDSAEEPGPSGTAERKAGEQPEGEEEEECGWCKWMKAGGCKEPFQVWLDCVDAVKAEGREDVESCASVMGPLWECMERHKEYYAPQLSSLADKKAGAAGAEQQQEEEEEEEADESREPASVK